MGEIVKNTLLATKHSVSAREGSFMVLGFDFMLDENLKVWLIEINTSPSNELSTPVTTKLIEEFQRAQAKLFLDYNVLKLVGDGKRNEGADIGKLYLLYRQAEKKESLKDKIMARNGVKAGFGAKKEEMEEIGDVVLEGKRKIVAGKQGVEQLEMKEQDNTTDHI